MRYKVKFEGYGYIEAENENDALLLFDPCDYEEVENTCAVAVKK